MRILQVVHGFPPQEWAGTELLTYYLSRALRDRGHEVTIFTRTGRGDGVEGSLQEEEFGGLPVFRVVNTYKWLSRFQLLYDNPFFNTTFLRLLERVRPDVVHVQLLSHLSVSLLRLSAALGYPTVLNLHDFYFPCHRIHLIDAQERLCPGPDRGERCVPCLQDRAPADAVRRRFLQMEQVLRYPQVVITPSVFLAEKMEHYFPALHGRIRPFPLGVHRLPGVVRERAPRTVMSPLRVLYVGVFLPHKGAHVLLEALHGLPADSLTVSLYGVDVAGWETYRERLRATAEGLPVQFHDAYPHDQFGEILRQHDVLVMPMIWEETFSILTREAFLAGLPVVAARRGALVEAIRDGIDGLLFEPENSADLRRCLLRLVTEPGLLDQLRAAAPSVKTMETYAEEIEALYQEFVPPAPAVPPTAVSVAGSPSSPLVMTSERPAGAVKVSVCIPTYNGAAFLAEAITSVLRQTFTDFELLIVDDGSTDTTLDIARSFGDPRITIHQNEKRLGIPANWNRGVALARGEYICIFHQDDVMMPENLARKLAVLSANPTVSFVHSAIEFLLEEGLVTVPGDWVEATAEDRVVEGQRYFRQLIARNFICAPTVVMRRTLFDRVGGFDDTLGFTCDYEMWLKLCMEGQVAFLSLPLVLYRWHEKNATYAYRFEKGVEELRTARQEAIRYYEERTGKQEEAELLRNVSAVLTEKEQWAGGFDRESERRLVYIKELEALRDKLWADVQRAGEAWGEQQAYIKELEALRDKLWADVQRVGKAWEEQRAYITDLEQRRDRSVDERVRRGVRRLLRFARAISG
ncbi:MAG: glycosyltransferase [Deltaproteobacteria bacterium]|nr:glycosyltransferase [Deltaproteobacteria bacterium]